MYRMKSLAAVALLAGCGWLAGVSAAEDRKDGDKGDKGGDKAFVHKASASGLAEVNLSQLALQFAHKAEVKQFARHMVTDHTAANQQLTILANRLSIPVARHMDEKHQKLFDKLKTLEGTKFDEAYMKGMVEDHEEAVKLFETASKDCKNEQLKMWAERTLPTLKRHHEMAEKLCKGEKKEKDRSDR